MVCEDANNPMKSWAKCRVCKATAGLAMWEQYAESQQQRAYEDMEIGITLQRDTLEQDAQYFWTNLDRLLASQGFELVNRVSTGLLVTVRRYRLNPKEERGTDTEAIMAWVWEHRFIGKVTINYSTHRSKGDHRS